MATAAQDIYDQQDNEPAPLDMLAQIAQTPGDLSELFTEQDLTTIGHDAVADYERDLAEQSDWRDVAEKALKRANQEREELTNAPPYRKSNVNYPILAVAALQFNARAYPAICKPGNMVRCKVVGSDKGRPKVDPQTLQPLVGINGEAIPIGQAQQIMAHMQAEKQSSTPPAQPGQPSPQRPALPQPQPLWDTPPGAKQKRADRVADYMNVYLDQRMDGWEEDTDQLLFEVPIVGCGFRKVWWQEDKCCAAYVSALDLIVPMRTRTLEEAPRITEKLNDQFPFQIKRRMNSGEYRRVELPSSTDDAEEPRLLLECHRWLDLDGDGVDEPYIVTIDHGTSAVLKIVANFGVEDVKVDQSGNVTHIDATHYYVKYPFLPHAKHVFYGMGFGHLTEQLGDIINTTLNQFFDAMHAQIAGGGWIAAGLRLQGNNRDSVMRWMPGEYKQVGVTGQDLRAGIVERTFPNIAPEQMQLLDMMLAAAKDITSVKDILTGDVPNTAPVGTTLAIVQQAQTVFTAIYKRIYRSCGNEFDMIFENLAEHANDALEQDYQQVLDDPAANFAQDFSEKDMDIKPVADPANVTNMQQIAKAQFLMGFLGKGLDDIKILENALVAGGIEDVDQYVPQGPAAPNPLDIAKLRQMNSAADLNEAKAGQASATSTKIATDIGHQLGESAGFGGAGGLPGLAGGPGNGVGDGGAGNAGASAGGGVGAGAVQPAGA